ncbi:hypothetical protein JCM9279_001520 [Rhodotorula babjevae]
MPRAPHPYGTQATTALAPADELHDSLSTRLEYAHFKLAHDRINHSLSELENLYLRPFHAQAVARAQAKRTDERRQRWREAALRADEARDRDGSAYLPPALDDDDEEEEEAAAVESRAPAVSAVKLGKRKAVDHEEPLAEHARPRRSTRSQPVRAPPPAPRKSDKVGAGKAKAFLVRFQGLPPTLDMNAVAVHEQPHVARRPTSSTDAGADGHGARSPAPDAPPVERGRRTSLRSSARAPRESVGAPSASSFLPGPASSVSRARSNPSSHVAPPVNALAPPPAAAARAGAPAPAPSPYSARSSAAFPHATLAPAGYPSPSTISRLPSTLSFAAPPPALSSSSSSSRPPAHPTSHTSLSPALGAHASFSALPPPPPLPFDDDHQHPDLVGSAARTPHPQPSPHAYAPRAPPSGLGPPRARVPRPAGTPPVSSWSGAQGGPRAREVRAAADALFQVHGAGGADDDEDEDDEDAAGSEDEVEAAGPAAACDGESGSVRGARQGTGAGGAGLVSPLGSDDERMPGPEDDDEREEGWGGRVDAGIGAVADGLEEEGDEAAAGLEYPAPSQDTIVDSQEYGDDGEEGAGGGMATQEAVEEMSQ